LSSSAEKDSIWNVGFSNMASSFKTIDGEEINS
jgi:hypothetical protein